MPITNGLLQMGWKLEMQGSGDGRLGPPPPPRPLTILKQRPHISLNYA